MARPRIYDESTRDELVRAAGDLIAARGAAGLSVRAVANEVGASSSSIYNLFGSKAELVRAMYVAGFGSLAARFARVATTEDPLVDLLALGLAYRSNALAQPHLYDVMFGRPFPEFTPNEEDAALAMGTLDVLRTTVGRCLDAGSLPGYLDVEDVTLALWALTHGLASLELAGGLGERGEDYWRTQLTAFATGLRSNTPER